MSRHARLTWLALIPLLAAPLLPACDRGSEPPDATPHPAVLDPEQPWHGDHRAALDELIATHGNTSPGYDAEHPPVAVFDWDNTVIKNDIGNGTFFWFLAHDVYRVPQDGEWSRTSRYLTPAALAALEKACGGHAAGAPLPTSTDTDCAAELMTIYEDRKTTGGDGAWIQEGYDHRAFVPAYAWLAQLLSGYTPGEVRDLARQAIDDQLAAPVGATQTVGGREGFPGYIRIYEPMRNLVERLQAGGFDVWVVSASPEPIVETFAERIGVDRAHVVGIRTLVDGDGRLTSELARCGPQTEGESAPIITYIDGKRCFIDEVIFGGPGTLTPNPDPAKRPVLVAGDAVTDISMLHDATALRLVIDRQKPEVLCHALAGTDGTWLVQPMFLEPLPARSEPYPCSTTACKDRQGQPTPCLGADGQPIPDQPAPAG